MEALELEPMMLFPSDDNDDDDTVDESLIKRRKVALRNLESSEQESPPSLSYWMLLRSNRPFTLYLCSYITNHTGEWLTYLASLTALSEMQRTEEGGDGAATATSIGVLVAVRLLTNVIAAPWGGALADAMDRRQAMILLDVAGAVIAFVFLFAVRWKSPLLIYVATFLQEFDSGLYEPSKSAIVPLLCPSDEVLEKATLLTSVAWSTVAATASAAGGLLVTVIGLQGCFVVDSITYLISAWFLTRVKGNWNVKHADKGNGEMSSLSATNETNSLETAVHMIHEGWTYLWTNPWGPLVGLKFSVTWLTMDVLMVDFAARGGEESSSLHLGALFAAVGVGCLIGPMVASKFTDLATQPGRAQVAAVIALACSTFACFLLSLEIVGNPLWVLCLCTVLRSSGVSALWVQSNLLLQKLSRPDFLGRVSSIDFGLALVGESVSALITGRLRDVAHLSPEQVCACYAGLGVVFTVFWTIFTWRGGGAMGYIPNKSVYVENVEITESGTLSDESSDESNEEMRLVTLRNVDAQ